MDSADNALLAVRSLPGIALAGLFLAELLTGVYARRSVPSRENWLNALSFLQDRVLVEPLSVFLGAWACSVIAPAHAGALGQTPFWVALPLFAVVNDFAHYWFHRWAHTNQLLWRVHATHHTATRMSVAVTPRLNVLWRLIFPTTYLGAAIVYLGLPEVYVIWWSITGALNFAVHTAFRWDLPLYERRVLRPIGTIVERILVTPDAHHAHHGLGRLGSGDGNFGQTLILWDRLFRTFHAPHRRQDSFGADGDVNASIPRQLLWPFRSAS